MYDLYVPLTDKFDMDIPYDKAQDIILEALKPLGEEYLKIIKVLLMKGGLMYMIMKVKRRSLFLGKL